MRKRKLVLKKETLARLSSQQAARMRGGDTFDTAGCPPESSPLVCFTRNDDCFVTLGTCNCTDDCPTGWSVCDTCEAGGCPFCG
jgi:hypothetical protein